MSTQTQSRSGQSPDMSDEGRGAKIKRRRLDLGIDSLHQFHEATGLDRRTLTRAEAGTASETTLDWLEAWLTREEAVKSGAIEAQPGSRSIKVTLRDAYGVGELILEGPVDADELAEAVGKVLDRLRLRDAE
jgi:transcriptional regulator with XRE-family HTH domain